MLGASRMEILRSLDNITYGGLQAQLEAKLRAAVDSVRGDFDQVGVRELKETVRYTTAAPQNHTCPRTVMTTLKTSPKQKKENRQQQELSMPLGFSLRICARACACTMMIRIGR